MPALRILSDLHYGDRASRVTRLAQLEPLLAGCARLVFNGDTLDTRPGPHPEHTARCREEIRAFAAGLPDATFLTGNHDPDISADHWLALAGGEVLALHGDVVFDDLVPWSQDVPAIRRLAEAAWRDVPAGERDRPGTRFRVLRAVALALPQRHQAEPHGLKYWSRFAKDTVWPPSRIGLILRAWREYPALLAAFAARHHPAARFVLAGHTHRPGVTRTRDGVVVVNTGSFCAPLGGCVVDLEPGRLRVRTVEWRRGACHPGPVGAEFPLAVG